MAGAEPEPENAGGSGLTLPGRSHSALRMAPLDPEQLRRVLELVNRPQLPSFALQDAAQRLRDTAQEGSLQRGSRAEVPRLLLPKQLEAICVTVTSGDTKSKERTMPPLATIQPRTTRQSQLPGGSSLGLSDSSPPLLRVQALGRTGSQLCFLRGSPQPPTPQVFVQKPLPALQPVPPKRVKAQQTANGHGIPLSPVAASSPHVTAPVSSGSAHLFISSLQTAHNKKLKKSLKVKTRSGRISRPPKYKARDYKFIKTEDLADGHLSDSDDYSELSVEEEEEQREKPVLFDIEGCALRPKAFKCQTCEKSYIGKGGLMRHFKLNPGHGQQEPEMLLSKNTTGSLTLGCAQSKTRGLTSPKPSTPTAVCVEEAESAWRTLQNAQPIEVKETLVPEPENRSSSAFPRPEKYLEPKSGTWEGQAEFSTADLQESRAAVQPNRGPAVPSGLSVSRGAQLREALRQCGREELVELVLPQLAQAVTLYELLLVKVEKSPGAKPFFPAVYKEFEELYDLVKRMCQDYFSSSGPCSREPLEINNDEVAMSLGITEFLRKKETHPHSTPTCSSQKTEGELKEASGQKRERERGVVATGEGLAKMKKPRTAALPTDVPACPPVTSGCHQKPWPLHIYAPASKSSAPAATENPSPCSEGICGKMVPASDGGVPPTSQQLAVMASNDFEARSGSADPALLGQDVSRSALYSQVAEPRGLPPAQESVFSEETAPEDSADQDSGAIQRSNSVCGTPSSGTGVEALLLGESGDAEAGNSRETNQPHLSGQQASPSHAPFVEATAFPVKIFPAACVSKSVPEPVPHPGPDRSLSTNTGPGIGNEAADISQFLSRMETHGQREPETVAAVGEPLVFEISDVCQEVLLQGQEIFIQTSNGLILFHPRTMVSQEEVDVIMTDAEGSILRFAPSEGVALEAMEAFLTVEAEPSQ